MAEPPATMTVTVAVPILASIYQSVRGLETEIRDLRVQLFTRLEALETQPTNQSPSNVVTSPAQDVTDDTTLAYENLGSQGEDRVDKNLRDQDDGVQDDLTYENDLVHGDNLTQRDGIIQEDGITYEDGITHEENTTHEENLAHKDEDGLAREDDHRTTSLVGSSPSVDEGITAVAERVIPPPTAGHKRKRTVHDASGRVNHSGFIFRSSDAQLVEKRSEHIRGPSRSESPFDNNHRPEPSSDEIPAARPRSPPSLIQEQARQRGRKSKKAKEDGLDQFVASKPEDFTIRYDHRLLDVFKADLCYSRYTGRIRKQTKRQSGFVSTPDEVEINRLSRQTKNK